MKTQKPKGPLMVFGRSSTTLRAILSQLDHFPDYLTYSQRAFRDGKWFDSVILGLHPSQMGAKEECDGWQERRNSQENSVEDRIAELTRYVEGLKTQP